MPNVAVSALDAALKRAAPDAAYLFHGDDEFLKEQMVRQVIDGFVDPGTRDFNLDVVQGSAADAGVLSTALDALPVMATRRVVVVRDFPALRKESREAVNRYLARPSTDTLLVLVVPGPWKADAAIASRTSVVEFARPTEGEAAQWAATRAAELSVAIEPDAARLLVSATGPDLAVIDGELRKLRDFSNGQPITADAVREAVGIADGRTASDLIDLVCSRDGPAASALVPVVLSQPKASAVGIVMSLTAHVLGIGQVLVDRGNRVPPRQQASNLYAMMGEARSAPVGRPWSEAVGAMTRHADRWDSASVDRALRLLAEADRTLKDAGYSSGEQVVATLVLLICARRKPAARAA